MCGINGWLNFQGLNDGQVVIESMCEQSKHRGPDHTGYHLEKNLAMGHNRLAIIDLVNASNQPFYSNDGNLVMVFNGEIYNYRELKAELKDYDFKTESDTEVLIAAYEKWGKNFVQRLNGMFAIAIWNVKNRELFLTRDRLGIKPLYFFDDDKDFLFSSEIRSLLSSDKIERKMSSSGLIDYLRYQTVHAPNTIIEGVYMLLPGYSLTVREDGLKLQSYWDIHTAYSKKSTGQSLDEVKREVKELLQESVRKRLVADVPFGAFLSGGIDSSAIVAMMAETSSLPVKTFSITFAEEEFSEAKYARIIAEKYKTDHTEIKLEPEDFLKNLPHALRAMDHPSGDGPNSYMVSKATKEAGVTMAFSGLGGDELFAGYDIFKRAASLSNKKWIFSFPPILRNMATGLLRKIKPSIASDKITEILAQDYLELPYFYAVNRLIFNDKDIRRLTGLKSLPKNSVREMSVEQIGHNKPGFSAPFLSKVSYLEINSYMQNVLLRDTDQMSMAHALEVRVPFLDHELLEYVYGIKDEFKYPYSPKELLVDSLGDLLPREIVDRKKMGFTLPWEIWMKKELKSFCEEQLSVLYKNGVLQEKALMNLWNAFLNGNQRVTWSRIWSLVVLGFWINQNQILYEA